MPRNPRAGSQLQHGFQNTLLTNGWSYDATNNTIVVTDPDALSTHTLATYEAFLGTATGFTNVSGGVTNLVPALNSNSLAGVPVDELFLGTVRSRLADVVGKYRALTSTNGAAWTPATILLAAGSTNGAWSPIANGLLTPQHFTELANVVALLTAPHEYCPCAPCGTNLPTAVTVTVALACEGEPVDPLCGPLDANPGYGHCTANDKAEVLFTANAPLARANVNGHCGWAGDIGALTLKTGAGAAIGVAGIRLAVWWNGSNWRYRWSGRVETNCGDVDNGATTYDFTATVHATTTP